MSILPRFSAIRATADQVSCDLAGEAVILHLESGVYYGLNEVGAAIWRRVQEPTGIGSLREALLAEYDVEPDRCDRDLLLLLQDLAACGLIENLDGTAA